MRIGNFAVFRCLHKQCAPAFLRRLCEFCTRAVCVVGTFPRTINWIRGRHEEEEDLHGGQLQGDKGERPFIVCIRSFSFPLISKIPVISRPKDIRHTLSSSNIPCNTPGHYGTTSPIATSLGKTIKIRCQRSTRLKISGASSRISSSPAK